MTIRQRRALADEDPDGDGLRDSPDAVYRYRMSQTAQRIQLYLTSAQQRAVRELARRKGASLARVIREALTEYLRREGSELASPWGDDDPFLAAIGTLELPVLGTGDSLTDAIDRSVYDASKR